MTDIHPTAIIDPAARLGAGVRIGPWCTVGPDVTLGDGVQLISHVVVDGITRIGDASVLHPFCSIGGAPQDLKYRGEPTACELGARVQIREFVTVNRGTAGGGGVTRVGDDCLLMACSHIAHDCQIGRGVVIANDSVCAGHVTLGDNVILGGQVAVQQFVRVGRAAMIGGKTGVERDVIPFAMVIGNRGWLAGLNVIGLRRRGYEKTQIHALRQAFIALFRDSEPVFAERLAAVRASHGGQPLVAEILAFMDAPSKRGLIRAKLAAEGEAEE